MKNFKTETFGGGESKEEKNRAKERFEKEH